MVWSKYPKDQELQQTFFPCFEVVFLSRANGRCSYCRRLGEFQVRFLYCDAVIIRLYCLVVRSAGFILAIYLLTNTKLNTRDDLIFLTKRFQGLFIQKIIMVKHHQSNAYRVFIANIFQIHRPNNNWIRFHRKLLAALQCKAESKGDWMWYYSSGRLALCYSDRSERQIRPRGVFCFFVFFCGSNITSRKSVSTEWHTDRQGDFELTRQEHMRWSQQMHSRYQWHYFFHFFFKLLLTCAIT